MTRQIQKAEEMRLVEQMRRTLGGVPAGRIEPTEEPDVCLISGDYRIGIEVTELHQSTPLGHAPRRLQESERVGIVRRAQVLIEASAMPAADVAVHFKDSVSITKDDRERIVKELVELVATHLPDGEGSTTVELSRQCNSLPWVHSVRIFRSSILTRHHWSVPQAGWVQMDFSSELQVAIRGKSARYARYRLHCDECWLLVVASGGRPSGLFEPSDKTRNHVYNSPFEKTFFMEAFSGKVIDLMTEAA